MSLAIAVNCAPLAVQHAETVAGTQQRSVTIHLKDVEQKNKIKLTRISLVQKFIKTL